MRWGHKLLARPHLYQKLLDNGDKKLVLLNAAAGYGKSTCMVQWHRFLSEDGHSTAWITLDEDDNDPVRLYSFLHLALTGSDHQLDPFMEARRATRAHAVRLAESMSKWAKRSYLFIDEFEMLTGTSSRQLIFWLIEYLPADCTVVIASRTQFVDTLSKLSMHGEVFELDEDDFRLNDAETADLVSYHGGLELDEARISSLNKVTEGWVAGVRLALIYQEAWGSSTDWIDTLSGEVKKVADFLYEQVFRRLDGQCKLFLLKSSILRRMSSSICRVLTEDPDAQDCLNDLWQKGLFIQPLDPQHTWFRMHGLMRQFLLSRLLDRLSEKEFVRLNKIAAIWFSENGDPLEAIHHAIQAREYDSAVNILASVCKELIKSGQLQTLVDLCARIPSSHLHRHYGLLSNLCLAHLLRNELAKAQRYMSLVQPFDRNPDALKSLAEIPILEPMLYVATDRMPRAKTMALENSQLLGQHDHSFEWGTLFNIIAYADVGFSDLPSSKAWASRARITHLETGSIIGIAYADVITAMGDRTAGNLEQALAVIDSIGIGADYGQTPGREPNDIVLNITHCIKLDVLYELDRLDDAQRLIQDMSARSYEIIMPDVVIIGYLSLARCAFAVGDVDQAYAYLDQGRIVGVRMPLLRLVRTMALQRARFAQLANDFKSASQYIKNANATIPSGEVDREPGYQHLVDQWLAIDLVPMKQSVFEGEARSVLGEVEHMLAEPTLQDSRRLHLLILKTECLIKLASMDRADETIIQTLDLARLCGVIRTLADSGSLFLGRLMTLYAVWKNTLKEDRKERLEYCVKVFSAARLDGFSLDQPPGGLLEELSEREVQVLSLVADGLKNDQIAERLFLSINTVKWHLRRVYEKFGVQSRTEAIAEARRRRVI